MSENEKLIKALEHSLKYQSPYDDWVKIHPRHIKRVLKLFKGINLK